MSKVKDTIHFYVEYSEEDEDYGPVFTASCVELAIVTDGKTLDEVTANVREAVGVHLDGVDTLERYNLAPEPRTVLTVELPAHAQAA